MGASETNYLHSPTPCLPKAHPPPPLGGVSISPSKTGGSGPNQQTQCSPTNRGAKTFSDKCYVTTQTLAHQQGGSKHCRDKTSATPANFRYRHMYSAGKSRAHTLRPQLSNSESPAHPTTAVPNAPARMRLGRQTPTRKPNRWLDK